MVHTSSKWQCVQQFLLRFPLLVELINNTEVAVSVNCHTS